MCVCVQVLVIQLPDTVPDWNQGRWDTGQSTGKAREELESGEHNVQGTLRPTQPRGGIYIP